MQTFVWDIIKDQVYQSKVNTWQRCGGRLELPLIASQTKSFYRVFSVAELDCQVEYLQDENELLRDHSYRVVHVKA